MAPQPISNKKSVLGLMKEVTEALPVRPASATDFTALQDGFSMSPAFETLANAELRASIGKAKDELGAENPSFNFSHYIKASGVVAQKPDFGLLIESCLGVVVVAAAERDTIVGSTVSAVNVNTGEGAEFQRGQAILSQFAGAFQIRNVLSVVTDTLNLAHTLANAPGVGVLLGRAILYKTLDEGHPTLSIWNYRGNGGAVEMMSGARVTEMSLEGSANQYINGSFVINGVSYYFNPMKIISTNNTLDYTDDTGAHVVTVAQKEYKSPVDLADALQNAINALSPSDPITVTYQSADGKFNIKAPAAALFEVDGTAANSILLALGYTATDKTGALTYTSEAAQSWATAYTPNFDDSNANVAKANEVIMGDSTDTSCFGAQKVSIKVANTKTDIPDLCEESGKSGSLFTAREVTVQITALLNKNDVSGYERFRKGTKTQFAYNFGVKNGGQFVKGSCVNVFLPSATITAFEIADQDGLAILNTTLTAYVEDGQGEFYMNFI
jgi:hypothetical protein